MCLFIQGHPFMESLLENKALLYSLTASAGAIMMLTTGVSVDFCQQFEIVPMPDKVGLIWRNIPKTELRLL